MAGRDPFVATPKHNGIDNRMLRFPPPTSNGSPVQIPDENMLSNSPSQARRAMESHLAETERRIQEASTLGAALVKQRAELSSQLGQLAKLQDGDEIDGDLKKKLTELEKEMYEVGRRPAVVTPIRHGAGISPTKVAGPMSRRQRNVTPGRVNDIKLATEISTSLLKQVRELQSALAEKDVSVQRLTDEKCRLALEKQNLTQRVRMLDESEQRYKDENWSLETRLQERDTELVEITERERRLHQAVKVAEEEKTVTERDLEELKQLHGHLDDEHNTLRRMHDTELSTLRRGVAGADAERSALHKRIDELVGQNQELADEIAYRIRAERQDKTDPSGGDDDGNDDDGDRTPEGSPPVSPAKGTPRHGHLESETLKSSLNHALRMIQNLKSHMHREKAEKIELRKMLQDAQDELDIRRNDSGRARAKKDKTKGKTKTKSKSQARLGRTVRTNVVMHALEPEDNSDSDPSWEDATPSRAVKRTRNRDSVDQADLLDDSGGEEHQLRRVNRSLVFRRGRSESVSRSGSGSETDDLDDGGVPCTPAMARVRDATVIKPMHRIQSGSLRSVGSFGSPGSPTIASPTMSVASPSVASPNGGLAGPSLATELDGFGMDEHEPDESALDLHHPSRHVDHEFGGDAELEAPIPPPELQMATISGVEVGPRDNTVLASVNPRTRVSVSVGIQTETVVEFQPHLAVGTVTGLGDAPADAGVWIDERYAELVVGTVTGLSTAATVLGISGTVIRPTAAIGLIAGVANSPTENAFSTRQALVAPMRYPISVGVAVSDRLDTARAVEDAFEPESPSQFDLANTVYDDELSHIEPYEPLSEHLGHPSPVSLSQSASFGISSAPEHGSMVAIAPPRECVPLHRSAVRFVADEPAVNEISATTHQQADRPLEIGTVVGVGATSAVSGVSVTVDQADPARAEIGAISGLASSPSAPTLPAVFASRHDRFSPPASPSNRMSTSTIRASDYMAPTLAASPNRRSRRALQPILDNNQVRSSVGSSRTVTDRLDRLDEKSLFAPRLSAAMWEERQNEPFRPESVDSTPVAAAMAGRKSDILAGAGTPISPQRPVAGRKPTPGRVPEATGETTGPAPDVPPMPSSFRPRRTTGAGTGAVVGTVAGVAVPADSTTGSLPAPRSTLPTTRSSMSSFVSEIDARFGMVAPTTELEPPTDPNMIQAITQTMIGEWLWKYTRRAGRSAEMSASRHRRYFWVHPYTRTLYWSEQDPSMAGRSQLRAKSVAIEAVRVVVDENPLPPGLHRKSLVVITPGRTIKFTAPTKQRHDTWFNSLSYLLLRAGDEEGGPADTTRDFGPPQTLASRVSLASLTSRFTSTATGATTAATTAAVTPHRTPRPPPATAPSPYATPVPHIRRVEKYTPVPKSTRSTRSTRSSGRLGAAIGTILRKPSGLRLRQSQPALSAGAPPSVVAMDPASYDDSSVMDDSHLTGSFIGSTNPSVLGRDMDRLENVRACCDGKHDVGSLSHRTRGGTVIGRTSHSHLHRHGQHQHHHHTHHTHVAQSPNAPAVPPLPQIRHR